MRWDMVKPVTLYKVVIEYDIDETAERIVYNLPIPDRGEADMILIGPSPCSYPRIEVIGRNKVAVQKVSATAINRLRKYIRDIE